MGYICRKNGARECTACRDCFSASVCDICGAILRPEKGYYKVSDINVCRRCVRKEIRGSAVCCFCGAYLPDGQEALVINDLVLCKECAERSEAEKDYV